MITDSLFVSEDGPRLGLSDIHVNSFLMHLRSQGYAKRTLQKKRSVLAVFSRWIVGKQLAVDDLNESHLTSFVTRFSNKRMARAKFEKAVLQLFLKHVRTEANVPITPPLINTPAAGDLKQHYIEYLRKERGLAENSIRVYTPFISNFLNDPVFNTGCIFPQTLNATTIQNFLLAHIRNRSSEYSRLLATSLRSFLRFLYLRKETLIDLSTSVPAVRRWQQAGVHDFLSPEEVERVLSACNLSIPSGRRDHAILLLLARLGLRAGEVVALELDDIHWRMGEIVVRGKGRVLDCLPLLSDIGDALALYISEDRSVSSSRQVFLRMLAPCVGLAGPCAIDHIVRRAFSRVGLRSPCRGAAHLFRHSLATTMIRRGASIAEISEILRHRSQNSTAIYAKVDFEALRGVARCWPGRGGAR
jgi:site-specific recombinase XerD